MRTANCLVIILSLSISACTSYQVTESTADKDSKAYEQQSQTAAQPVMNRAIAMTAPHAAQPAYSLYSIEPGESRASVEEKYRLVGCRKDIFYVRCGVWLDTRGVDGLSNDEKIMVFIAFDNADDRVHDLAMPVSAASLSYTKKMLQQFYGAPASITENKSSWLNNTGKIEFEESADKTRPSVLKYSLIK